MKVGPARPRLSLAKKLRFSAILFVLFFAAFETAARVGSYLYYGRNPYYLLYGLRSWSNEEGEGHTDKYAGYMKFPPNRTLEYGTPEPARINSLGFRGADFEPRKRPGTFRVICMGASSTFGYLNTDAETYPVRLEGLLADLDVEVINAGIPHFTTDHLLACLEGELLSYQPDLLTIYTGCNDAVRPEAETHVQKACRVLDEYSAGYAALRKGINAAFGDVLFGQWTPYLNRMDAAAVQRQIDLHLQTTRANFERMIAAARERGVPFVFILQPITTWFDKESRGLIASTEPRTTYEEEFARLEEMLVERGGLPGFEVTLYVHHYLNDCIRELAREHGIPVVDNVALVAEHPEGLGSKVHLTKEANARLAEALAQTIRPMVEESRSHE